jgi:hypothetical protein
MEAHMNGRSVKILWLLFFMTACASLLPSQAVELSDGSATSCKNENCIKLDVTQEQGRIDVLSTYSDYQLMARCVYDHGQRTRSTHLGKMTKEYSKINVIPKQGHWEFTMSEVQPECRLDIWLISATDKAFFSFRFR